MSKPPMCFSTADAETLVTTLDRVLGESAFDSRAS